MHYVINFATVILGLALTGILFYRFPRLPEIREQENNYPLVSVIIPARNEANTLPLLLRDLRQQSLRAFEIICVDDDSRDETAEIARSYGAGVISSAKKPRDWIGKSWACHQGVCQAKGEIFLFLDADVRLQTDGLRRLMQAYTDAGCPISVQPYHKTKKLYEQFSMIFNLIQTAANGTALAKPINVGLYGPVILISKRDYNKIGGHEQVKDSIIEDMALGQSLKDAGIPYQLFVGEPDIAYRMYPDSFRSLLQGWTKNMSAGASKTPPLILIMTFLWVTSLASAPLYLLAAASQGALLWMLLYSLLYIAWVFILRFLTSQIGCYRLSAVIFFPLMIFTFIIVFAVSLFKQVFGLKTSWKGRAIERRDKSCG